MATYQYGPQEKNVVQITDSDTVKLEVCLFDSTTPTTPKTGVAFGSVTATYCKPGEATFSAFPSWGATHWVELGNGWYQIVIHGATPAELALLNATGPLKFALAISGAVCPPISRTIVAADVARLTTAAEANFLAEFDDTGYVGGVIKRRVDLVSILGAAITGTAAWLAGAFTKLFNIETPLLTTGAAMVSVSGLATSAEVLAITQAQRVRVIPPPMMERPDAGSITYRVYIYAYDAQHIAEDLDNNPTVTAENNAAVDRSANLSVVTKPGGTTGQYYVDYTVPLAHAVEGLLFKVNATEAAVTTQYAASSIVVDTTAVDFTATDRANLEAVLADTGTDGVVVAPASKMGYALSEVGVAAVQDGLSTLTAQGVANALKFAPAAGDPAAGSVNADLDAIVAATGGTGQIPVTVTVTDHTDPQAGVIVSLNSTATGAVVAGPRVTNEDGEAVFNRTEGELLTATPTTTPFLSGGSTAFTVGAVATPVTCEMDAAAAPAPVPADCYRLYGYERKTKADGALANVTVTIVQLSAEGRTDAAANAQRAPNADYDVSDANGRWYLDIAKAAIAAQATITLQKTWTNAAGRPTEETWTAKLDVAHVDEVTNWLAFADLSPEMS